MSVSRLIGCLVTSFFSPMKVTRKCTTLHRGGGKLQRTKHRERENIRRERREHDRELRRKLKRDQIDDEVDEKSNRSDNDRK